jgi:hypothetical protein
MRFELPQVSIDVGELGAQPRILGRRESRGPDQRQGSVGAQRDIGDRSGDEVLQLDDPLTAGQLFEERLVDGGCR